MRKFKAKQFELMAINPETIEPFKPIIQQFPKLKVYKEFHDKYLAGSELDFNKVFRYIACVYQPKSPFFEIEDLGKRKVLAGLYCKFPKAQIEDDGFLQRYNDIINHRNKKVIDVIICFVKMFKSTSFTKLVLYNESMYAEMKKLMGEDDSKVIVTIRTNIEKFSEDVEKLKSEILFGDSHDVIVGELLYEVEDEQLKLSPEAIARKVKAGDKNPAGNGPYGKDYEAKDLKLKEIQADKIWKSKMR